MSSLLKGEPAGNQAAGADISKKLAGGVGPRTTEDGNIGPFEKPDIYYGPETDPSNTKGRFGKLRTRSEVFSRGLFNTKFLDRAQGEKPRGKALFDLLDGGASDKESADSVLVGSRAGSSDTSSSSVADEPEMSGRSSSFMKKYLKGLDVWNKLTQAGKIGKEPEPVAHAERGITPEPEKPEGEASYLRRRGSTDSTSSKVNSKRFFISDIDGTLKRLLESEDTDHNCQITIEDTGPKVMKLGTANSAGYKQYDIRGTYMLSNLLQELTIAKRMGRKQMILDEARLNENPVDRLRRLISTVFWKNLRRQVTEDSVLEMASDTKIDSPDAKYPRIYVPHNEPEQYFYYTGIAKRHPEYQLQVEYLPEKITDEWVKSINGRPGFLALATRHKSEKYGDLEGYPYIVPGGRFNEQYGWDSYFETLGLLESGQVEPCIGMCRNFIFEISHYGKILNANRSYYLCRSQPPFLTQMTLKIFNYIKAHDNREDLGLLKDGFTAAIKEYKTVWCCAPRLDQRTGLSTYYPSGLGIPPETEASHFDALLTPYSKKHNMSLDEFRRKYNDGEIDEPELDEYFVNDRAVRESGHDTTYRMDGLCAHLATVDLNSLLYKYETDIAYVIKTFFNDSFVLPDGTVEKSATWTERAERRKKTMNRYMWSEHDSMYYDYNVQLDKRSKYESVTSLYPLWAGICTPEQAKKIVENTIPKFEEFGGLVSGTKRSRGPISVERPSRQWDYPFAWAPHQMMAWKGLSNYGYKDVARRLAYRWCYMMTFAFVDFNGIVVEKYDATSEKQPHRVEAEYGNQGSGFKGVATEGFGWVNASYMVGLGYLDKTGIRALGMVTSPRDFLQHMNANERKAYGVEGGQKQLARARKINAATKV